MACEVRVKRRDTNEYVIPTGTDFMFPTNPSGIPYLIELINHDPYADADVDLYIDGELVGIYRVRSDKSFGIEKAPSKTGGFSLFPNGTGPKARQPDNGKVKTVWRFDADHSKSSLINTSTGEFQRQVQNKEADDGTDYQIQDMLACRYMIIIPEKRRAYTDCRYCDDGGITYHTAATSQKFNTVKALEKTRDPITIAFMLVMPPIAYCSEMSLTSTSP